MTQVSQTSLCPLLNDHWRRRLAPDHTQPRWARNRKIRHLPWKRSYMRWIALSMSMRLTSLTIQATSLTSCRMTYHSPSYREITALWKLDSIRDLFKLLEMAPFLMVHQVWMYLHLISNLCLMSTLTLMLTTNHQHRSTNCHHSKAKTEESLPLTLDRRQLTTTIHHRATMLPTKLTFNQTMRACSSKLTTLILHIQSLA